MPRGLEEIASFYLPELSAAAEGLGASPERPAAAEGLGADPQRSAAAEAQGADPKPPAAPKPAALPILTVPVAGRDAVRAAFAWNLTVELARLGAHATLVAPQDPEVAALWPESGRGPLGARALLAPADDAAGLCHAALDAAVQGAAEATEGGVVVVAVPPTWLCAGNGARPLWRWLLLWSTPEATDLCEAYGLAKLALARGSDPLVGLVIHGVRRRAEAESAFGRVADLAARRLGRIPISYGLLADDLHVFRAITARRPIGLEHPQSRAARALRDVAGMLWEDARKLEVV